MKKQNLWVGCMFQIILTGFILVGCQSTTVATGSFDENLIGTWNATVEDTIFQFVIRLNKTASMFMYDNEKNIVNQGVVQITNGGRTFLLPSGEEASVELNGNKLDLLLDGDRLTFLKVEQ